ncbi:DNA replication terminus site-binding protein [Pseudoalteromonas phenolica]|uniref:DNA replication terminus site-binding protein n=1 Tax=Pseudoalteromonas phenolica TaxID=161398 RepID=A0A0S2K8Z4_9GAMM|nr:DNA replication terminus site-binding protein [Pseudoalteromonas phenolica]ALO44697.1 DNA replication terminus site-binding protein [Pseudoalteromonas phenolica]MBE0357731.1 DNA replication terminus site-binding protein [Pseudoalteromonas phenolica O-BC30]
MNINFLIKAQFDLLQNHLELFSKELETADVIAANYYDLPNYEKDQEHTAPEEILVHEITGQEALKKIVFAFSDLFLSSEKSGKVLTRHPGIVLVNDKFKHLQNRINSINIEKAKFKELILSIPNNDARFEAVHSAIPNLITLAAYRKIHFESESPYSIRFSWMKKHATKTLTKDTALEMLERSSKYSNPRAIDQESWLKAVESERMRVASLGSDSKLRIRRPTRVTPEVNVRFTATNRYHVSGALPFVMLNPNKKLKVGSLPNYDSKVNDPRKKEYNFLVDRIYLERKE